MKLQRHYRDNNGFTLIEVLVTLGIFIFITSFALGVGLDTYARTSINQERDNLVFLLSKARVRALSNINQTKHGLYVDNTSHNFVLFQGTSYNPADPENEDTPYNDSYDFDGDTTFIFEQLSGDLSGSSDKEVLYNGDVLVTVNSAGGISW